jgi:hypothetical protein
VGSWQGGQLARVGNSPVRYVIVKRANLLGIWRAPRRSVRRADIHVTRVSTVLLGRLKEQLQTYDSVYHDEHKEAPKDYLAINLRAAIIKARAYYTKLDDLPAYYAATILHP